MYAASAVGPADYITKMSKQKQERPLGQRKTPPANNHLFVTSRKVVILLLANISVPYRYPTTENLSDLDFDLSRLVNVKFDNAIGLALGSPITGNS